MVLVDHDQDAYADSRFELVDGAWSFTTGIDEDLIQLARVYPRVSGDDYERATEVLSRYLR